ncbi:MAG: chemotaxis protein CheA [Myxococcaceae bacterium]|nr:chemotaxis protein CheA [Myxococcaceae bacterium]
MNPEAIKYLGVFTTEAQEHLDRLNDLLIRLEKSQAESLGSIHEELMRRAHSLKGGAAMMGLTASAQMAHRFEDWIIALRGLPDEIESSLLSAKLVDGLLTAVDHIGQLLQAEIDETPQPERPPLLERIARQVSSAQLLAERLTTPKNSEEVATESPSLAALHEEASPPPPLTPRFRLSLTIEPSSPMPALRAFLAHKKLDALGTILSSRPSADELRSGKLPGGTLELELSADFIDIARAIHSLTEIAQTEIAALDRNAAESCPAPRDLLAVNVDALVAEVAAAKNAQTSKKPPTLSPAAIDSRGGKEGGVIRGERGEISRTLRVKAELLDTVLDSMGDFLISIARMRSLAAQTAKAHTDDRRLLQMFEGLDALHIDARTLHNQVLSARLMPLASIMGPITRAARDLARTRGRELDFSINGDEVMLDHAVLEVLGAPLLHIIRNAVDHGLESPDERASTGKSRTGHIWLTARREQAHILLRIADDGRGMSAQKLKEKAIARGLISKSQSETLSERAALRLCFLHGLSTAETVSDISGRGVGMDVVRRAIEGIGGHIDLASRPNQGTTWTITLPYTVAIVQALFVRLGETAFGIPTPRIAHVDMAAADTFIDSHGQPYLSWRGTLVPVFDLGAMLRVDTDFWPSNRPRPVVIVDSGERQFALLVDALIGTQRSILRLLKPPLNLIGCLTGVTIRTSGLPAFILDVRRLFSR